MPHARGGKLRGADQLLGRREVQAHRLQSGLSTAQIKIYSSRRGEIAELDAVLAFVVGRTPLITYAEIKRELGVDFPVILKVETGFSRFVGDRWQYFERGRLRGEMIDIVGVTKKSAGEWVPGLIAVGIRVAIRGRRGHVIGEVEGAGRIGGLKEVVVKEPLL